MTNSVTVTGLSRVSPAEYEAQWNGHALTIILDVSAKLKLMGNVDDDHKADALSAKAPIVATVAQRLIDQRLEKPGPEGAIIMISALDLEDVQPNSEAA